LVWFVTLRDQSLLYTQAQQQTLFPSYKLREWISVTKPSQRVKDLKMKSIMPFRHENEEETYAYKGPEIGLKPFPPTNDNINFYAVKY
jgi:hypothetical protein